MGEWGENNRFELTLTQISSTMDIASTFKRLPIASCEFKTRKKVTLGKMSKQSRNSAYGASFVVFTVFFLGL